MPNVIRDWNDIKNLYNWSVLLIGNGASMAVWRNFGYPSLYDYSVTDNLLSAEDQELFDAGNTRNFEQVLGNLKVTEETCNIINIGSAARTLVQTETQVRYQSIRTALVSAVNKIHIDWVDIKDKGVLEEIRKALRKYKFVFSTNYDLLVYWSIMHGASEFVDYFWTGHEFDITDIEIFDKNKTKVLYLHGALHLYTDPLHGTTRKLVSSGTGQNIRETLNAGNEIPLFISEGNSKDKLVSINRSDYLSFAHGEFRVNADPTVVLGHSLSKDSDGHIVSAIKLWDPTVPVAVSIFPSGDSLEDQRRMANWAADLRRNTLLFFNSQTHPLGLPTLNVTL